MSKTTSSLITDLTKEEVVKLMTEYPSMRQIFAYLKIRVDSSSYSKLFRSHCENLGLNINTWIITSPMKGKKRPMGETKEKSNEIIFVKNSNYNCISHLKTRILRDKLLPENCQICHLGFEWRGNFLMLQLDHINGISNDHTLENLRFLCPNCHAQTDNFTGKNMAKKMQENLCIKCQTKISRGSTWCHFCSAAEKVKSRKRTMFEHKGKINYPDYEALTKLISESNISATAKMLGVSPSAIKKKMVNYAKEQQSNIN